jgi:hypothetical protein
MNEFLHGSAADNFAAFDQLQFLTDQDFQHNFGKLREAINITVHLLSRYLGDNGPLFQRCINGDEALPPRPGPPAYTPAPAEETPEEYAIRQNRNAERAALTKQAQANSDSIHWAYEQILIRVHKALAHTSYGSHFQSDADTILDIELHEGIGRLSMAILPTSITKGRINFASALSKPISPTTSLVQLTAEFRKDVRVQRDRLPGDSAAQRATLSDAMAITFLVQRMDKYPRFRKVLASLNDLDEGQQDDLEATFLHLLDNAHLVDEDDAAAHAIDVIAPDPDHSSLSGDIAVIRARAGNKVTPAKKAATSDVHPPVGAPDDTDIYVLKLNPRQLASTKATYLTAASPSSNRANSTTKNIFYCWSHGITTHSSATCKHPKKGHQRQATIDNMMGGTPSIHSKLRGDA